MAHDDNLHTREVGKNEGDEGEGISHGYCEVCSLCVGECSSPISFSALRFDEKLNHVMIFLKEPCHSNPRHKD